MFIEDDKVTGGPGHRRELEPLTVVGAPDVLAGRPTPTGVAVVGAKKGVHGDAAGAGIPTNGTLGRTGVMITRAFVNAQVASQVRGQNAVLDELDVSIHGGGVPTHHVVDPVPEGLAGHLGSSFDDSEVVSDAILAIMGVHDPTQRQLSGVAQAHDALSFYLGPAQSRQ